MLFAILFRAEKRSGAISRSLEGERQKNPREGREEGEGEGEKGSREEPPRAMASGLPFPFRDFCSLAVLLTRFARRARTRRVRSIPSPPPPPPPRELKLNRKTDTFPARAAGQEFHPRLRFEGTKRRKVIAA